MSCNHLLHAQCIGFSDGKPSYKVIGSWSGVKKSPWDVPVPCGQCIGCRLDKSRQWADRMMLELDHSKTAVFVTLTYDNEHVPIGLIDDNGVPTLTLFKRDFQLFMKRLRKCFSGRDIRFYAAGEYGDQTLRPHYHAILFGLSLSDFPDLFFSGRNAFSQAYYGSALLYRLWSNGNVSLSSVSWQTCAYVARYVMKKQTGKNADLYSQNGIEPPFALMSRRPGIAGFFAVEHPDKLDSTYQYIIDDNGVTPRTKISTPKYLIEKLADINPDLYDQVKKKRACFANDKMLLELYNTDLDVVAYMDLKERDLARRLEPLVRDKDIF